MCAALAISCARAPATDGADGRSAAAGALALGAAPDTETPCRVEHIARCLTDENGRPAGKAARNRLFTACLDVSDRLCERFLDRFESAPVYYGVNANMLCAGPCAIEIAEGHRRAVRETQNSPECGAAAGARDDRPMSKKIADIVEWCRPNSRELADCSPAAIAKKTANMASVIAAAILERRKRLRAEIEARMQAGVDAYPAEAALVDAIVYHHECSIATGLLAARRQIRERETLAFRESVSAIAGGATDDGASADCPGGTPPVSGLGELQWRLWKIARCLPREAPLRYFLDDAVAAVGGR